MEETYRWELARASRDACEQGDGDGACRSHSDWSSSQESELLWNEAIEAEGVTNALRLRTWAGERRLWGVSGAAREGAGEVREEEREGGPLGGTEGT